MLPKDSDLKEGGDLAEAADVIFGLMSPYREKLSAFLGYRVMDTSGGIGLKGRMLVLNVIKNRHGVMVQYIRYCLWGKRDFSPIYQQNRKILITRF